MKGKIIIAEDNEDLRKTWVNCFEDFFDIKVDEAKDGQELVEKVAQKDYDIIFTDYEMPRLDGIEATKKIREFNKEIPIYMNSGNREEYLKNKAIEAGVTEFTLKGDMSMKGIDYFEEILQKYNLI